MTVVQAATTPPTEPPNQIRTRTKIDVLLTCHSMRRNCWRLHKMLAILVPDDAYQTWELSFMQYSLQHCYQDDPPLKTRRCIPSYSPPSSSHPSAPSSPPSTSPPTPTSPSTGAKTPPKAPTSPAPHPNNASPTTAPPPPSTSSSSLPRKPKLHQRRTRAQLLKPIASMRPMHHTYHLSRNRGRHKILPSPERDNSTQPRELQQHRIRVQGLDRHGQSSDKSVENVWAGSTPS
jgi:hypothetical protein